MCNCFFPNVSQNQKESLYALFRIVVGFLFFCHGLQKAGFLGGDGMSGFMLFIGWAELLGGLAVMVGFLTRPAAAGSAIIMIGAYTRVHMGKALLPLSNGGELALLYLVAFLVIMAYGAGKWSIESKCPKCK